MSFRDVRAWVFDLDNTLYPAGSLIYDLIRERMTDYVGRVAGLEPDAAFELQERYFDEYGATLAGLIRYHDVDGRDFLDYVHDVNLECVEPDPELAHLIAMLPGKRIVFTNGGRAYAERVSARIGLEGLFDDLFDIEAAGFVPKPQRASFEALIERHGLAPDQTLFFEDSPRNLETAHSLGFRTVLIDAAAQSESESFPAHIHHASNCIKAFLRDTIAPALRPDMVCA